MVNELSSTPIILGRFRAGVSSGIVHRRPSACLPGKHMRWAMHQGGLGRVPLGTSKRRAARLRWRIFYARSPPGAGSTAGAMAGVRRYAQSIAVRVVIDVAEATGRKQGLDFPGIKRSAIGLLGPLGCRTQARN